MNLVVLVHSLIAVAVIALAILVLRAKPDNPSNRTFALAAFATAAWVLGVLGRLSSATPEVWLRISFAAASMIPSTVLLFVESYPSPEGAPTRPLTRIALLIGALFSITALTTNLIVLDPVVTASGLSRRPGPLYTAFAAYFLASWLLALFMLAHKTLRARGASRARLQFLTVAIALTSIGPITTNLVLPLLTGRSSYTWLGPFFSVIFLVLVAHAIIRHQLLDLRVIVHRSLIVMLATAASLAPAAIVLVGFWSELSAGFGSRQFALFLVAVLGSVVLAIFMRDWIGKLLDLYVYRTRTNYQAAVQHVSKALTRVLEMRTLLGLVLDRLAAIFKPEGLALYVLDGGTGHTIQHHAALSERFSAPGTLPQAMLAYLRRRKEPLELEPTRHAGLGSEPVRSVMAELNWALALPLLSDDAVIGVMILGPKLSGDPYYPQDLDLLATLANQAGIAVKNAQLYAEVVLANEYVENIVATINSGVVAINSAGRVTLFNRAAEALTGMPADAVRHQSTSLLPACLGEPLARAVADGRAVTYPEIALPGVASSRPAICTVSPLRDAAGRVLGGVAVFSDLTPVKELEIERRRAEKLDYFKSLASGFAHEIKNPLVSIKTFVQLVPHRLEDRRWLEEFSRIVYREIERLERLLQRLAALGRASERPQRLLDLRQPIREALELVQPEFTERRIRVTSRLGERAQTIVGDRDEIQQLAHNLLVNALQHTPVDGGVTVELAAVADCAILTVADTGPGIPPEFLEKIFDPFVTTRKHGTGLGLAICAGIAAAHRARLRVANRESGGATFTVEFPLGNGSRTAISA